MTKYQEFRKRCIDTGITVGEAYDIVHKIWKEDDHSDMEDLGKIKDPDLHYLYNH